MAVETISKNQARAAQYFEDKLNFETTPYGLHHLIKEGEKLTIIDLRTPELFAKGHVPGAVNIAYEDLEKNFSKLSKETTTVVYCYDLLCKLATRAALLLAQNGFNVKELVGGYDEWQAKSAHFPSEAKGQSSCSTASGSSCA